jgi:hypothetical protein
MREFFVLYALLLIFVLGIGIGLVAHCSDRATRV